MKTVLEFDDVEDRDSFDTYTHAVGYSLMLWEIENKMRERMKYCELTAEAYKELEDLQSFICDKRLQYHLPLD